jgi:hypothetical protein
VRDEPQAPERDRVPAMSRMERKLLFAVRSLFDAIPASFILRRRVYRLNPCYFTNRCQDEYSQPLPFRSVLKATEVKNGPNAKSCINVGRCAFEASR